MLYVKMDDIRHAKVLSIYHTIEENLALILGGVWICTYILEQNLALLHGWNRQYIIIGIVDLNKLASLLSDICIF